jgi:hypothetical protein
MSLDVVLTINRLPSHRQNSRLACQATAAIPRACYTAPQIPASPSIPPPASTDPGNEGVDSDAVDEPACMGQIKSAKRAGTSDFTHNSACPHFVPLCLSTVPRRAWNIFEVAHETNQPQFPNCVRQYLYNFVTNGTSQSPQEIDIGKWAVAMRGNDRGILTCLFHRVLTSRVCNELEIGRFRGQS